MMKSNWSLTDYEKKGFLSFGTQANSLLFKQDSKHQRPVNLVMDQRFLKYGPLDQLHENHLLCYK